MSIADPPTLTTLAEVCAEASALFAADELSPLAETPFLLFDAGEAESLPEEEQQQVSSWLRRQAVPTIAVGGDAGNAMVMAADVAVAASDEVQHLLVNVRRCPIAAAVLVQLLRATAGMAISDALAMESLAYATLQSGPEFLQWLQSPERKRLMPAVLAADEAMAVVVRREDDHLEVMLNQPSRHNAITVEVRDGLVEAFQLVLADTTIRSLRVSGRGRCFSVGGDLGEFGTAPDPATGHAIRGLRLPARFLAQCADRAEFHLHGACIGAGIELPAFARRVVAAEDAFFQLPELRFGLIPGAGGCIGIPRRIGRQRTALLALSGRRLNAATALEWGLVDEVRSG